MQLNYTNSDLNRVEEDNRSFLEKVVCFHIMSTKRKNLLITLPFFPHGKTEGIYGEGENNG